MAAIDHALLPGAFLVDAFPIRTNSSPKTDSQRILHCSLLVKYVPEWFPGAGFKTFARVARKDIDNSITPPFQHVKESFEVRESSLTTIFVRAGGSLGRTPGGDPYHFLGCGNVF